MNYSFIINVITILISLVALSISIKNRRNALREKLYDRQLSFIIKIKEFFYDFDELCDDLQKAYESKESSKITESKRIIAEKEIEFYKKMDECYLLFPDKIVKLITEYHNFYDRILNGMPGKPFLADSDEIVDNELDFEDELREFIGVDNLSEENRRLLSGHRSKLNLPI